MAPLGGFFLYFLVLVVLNISKPLRISWIFLGISQIYWFSDLFWFSSDSQPLLTLDLMVILYYLVVLEFHGISNLLVLGSSLFGCFDFLEVLFAHCLVDSVILLFLLYFIMGDKSDLQVPH